MCMYDHLLNRFWKRNIAFLVYLLIMQTKISNGMHLAVVVTSRSYSGGRVKSIDISIDFDEITKIIDF